jgi:hypothetical protein
MAPRSWIRTAIQTQETLDRLAKNGVEFATVESAVKCVMRISCDKSINGKGAGYLSFCFSWTHKVYDIKPNLDLLNRALVCHLL